jgi:hypothetical protein
MDEVTIPRPALLLRPGGWQPSARLPAAEPRVGVEQADKHLVCKRERATV